MKNTLLSLTPLATALTALCHACPVLATEDSTHHDDDVITVSAPQSSPLTVVTSPKTPRQPVPASDGSDYLKTIPGFSQIRNGGTNGDPVFRGMFGSRLRLLTNDGEMLGACPARMDAPSSYISPESYDLLTLIKGPQTVLWGPGNSAGTVRFERQPPQFDHAGVQGSASLLAASNHRWDQNADLSIGNETGYLRLTGSKSRSDDYRDGHGNRVPSKWDKWSSDVTLGWTPDKDTLLELSAGKSDGEARYAGRSMDGSQFKRESLSLRFEKSNIGRLLDKFEASAYYNYADHVMDNYSLRTPGSMSMGGMSMSMPMAMQLDRRTVGGRMMTTWLWQDYQLQTGVDTQLNTHRSLSDDTWAKDARFHDYGAFGELTWFASEQNKIIAGARLDRALADNFTAQGAGSRSATLPAGFIRLEHTLDTVPVMLYAGLGYTTRFPDYWELFSPTYGPGGSVSAFDNLKTEKTAQWDIGAQYKGERLTSWVSAYAGRVKDFILFRYDPDNTRISQADNVNALTLGGEAGLSYALTDHWKTDVSLAYSWAQNRTDRRPLPQIPPLEARWGLNWESGNWSSGGLLRLVSRQNRIALNEGNVVGKDFGPNAGFAIVSANLTYKVTQQVKVSAGVDNLFDVAYSEHLNLAGNSSFGYSANTAVNEPGRTFWGRLSVTF